MKTVSAREANQKFSQLLAAVGRGEEIVITRRGLPVARLLPHAKENEVTARREAYERMVKRMRKGVHLGGGKATRDEMHER